MRCQCLLQVRVDHTGLDDGQPVFDADPEDPVHPEQIQNNAPSVWDRHACCPCAGPRIFALRAIRVTSETCSVDVGHTAI